MMLNADWLQSPDIRRLGDVFARAGFELRWVGGCVRDTILARPFTEFDAASNATPEQMMTLLEDAGIRAIPTGIKHGTITTLLHEKPYEITTLRKDIITDGRHAEIAFTNDWKEDARRRDFTMNALYMGMDGTLYDDVGGYADCKARHVRFIGDPESRIKEDYLRILRYFRFVASVGNNQFDADALAACAAQKGGINQLSGERIAQELLKLLAGCDVAMAVEKLLPLLPFWLTFPKARTRLLDTDASALLKLASLIAEVEAAKPIAQRLSLSGKQRESLMLWLAHAPLITPNMNELAQKKLVRKLGASDYIACVRLAYALGEEKWQDYEPLLAMSKWQPPTFPITAKDLMAKGYQEGKELGDTLRELEKAWEENGYT